MTDSIEETGERLFIEDFDTWDMTGYYLYSKLLRSGVSGHIGTWGTQPRVSDLMRGKIDVFGLDALVNMAARLVCASS